jgi:hypothetical protein
MTLNHISDRLAYLGSRFDVKGMKQQQNSEPPPRESFSEYLTVVDGFQTKSSNGLPYVTIICLIYSGIDWLEFQYSELLALKKELGPGEVEILFVANDASQDVLDFLKGNNIPFVSAPGRKHSQEWYINSVYRGYNFGASQARGRYLLFVNSDMAYCPGFLHSLLSSATPEDYVSGKLIESGRLKPAEIAIKKNFGKTLKSFRRKAFYKYAKKIRSAEIQSGGLYMPAIVSKAKFLSTGGYPEGNLRADSLQGYLEDGRQSIAEIGEPQISGDNAFVRKFLLSGGCHITLNSAIVYHFQEGEKTSASSSANKSISSGIAISNDQLIGINGEMTLWNYLMQDLEARGTRVLNVPLGVNQQIPYRFSRRILWRNPKPRLVFRNATFLRRISGPWNQIALLQDRVVTPKIVAAQQRALKDADALVTNSWALFETEFSNLNKSSYVLPLPVHPTWESSPLNLLAAKDFDAIFVGAFNETKGWMEVRELVYKFPDTKFLLISKYQNDNPNFSESVQPKNVEILRCLGTDELLSYVDRSRIFIVGSPFETQCLAAMEAAFRDVVICMKPTGILAQLPLHLKNQVGEFDEDLSEAFKKVLERLSRAASTFSPAQAMVNAGLNGLRLRENWTDLLLQELERTFQIEITPSVTRRIKNLIPLKHKIFLRKMIT